MPRMAQARLGQTMLPPDLNGLPGRVLEERRKQHVAVDGQAERRDGRVSQPVEPLTPIAQVVDGVGQVDGEVGDEDEEHDHLPGPAKRG
jgi:hypothetical protein